MKYVNFKNDSESLLLRPLEPKFSEKTEADAGQYMDCYWALLTTLRKLGTGQALDLSYEDFGKYSCFYSLDLKPDPMSRSSKGSFSIETRFTESTKEPLTGLVVGEFSSCMMLNKNREVFCFDY